MRRLLFFSFTSTNKQRLLLGQQPSLQRRNYTTGSAIFTRTFPWKEASPSNHNNHNNMQKLRLIRWMAVVLPVTSLASSSSATSPYYPTSSPNNNDNDDDALRKIVVVGGTHGNEYTGVWCIHALERAQSKLRQKYPSLQISTLLANPQAHLQNKRFIDVDLNREFSHDKLVVMEEEHGCVPPTVESLRAKEIDALLGPKFIEEGGTHTTDLIIDLHSTTSNMGLSIIIPEGDPVMAQAAAYVVDKCGGEEANVRCLMHSLPNRDVRPNLSSAAKHGFTIEVGPVPQGVLRHDAVELTEKATYALFEFMEQRNSNQKKADLQAQLEKAYPLGQVPCFRSAPAKRPGEMSGKIPWPSHPENPNFPFVMIHKSLQDRDFHLIRKGDPLFVDLDGNIVEYTGSHGQEVYLIFVNEGGYYYASSGTGIGVAVKTYYDYHTGRLEVLTPEQEKEDETPPEEEEHAYSSSSSAGSSSSKEDL